MRVAFLAELVLSCGLALNLEAAPGAQSAGPVDFDRFAHAPSSNGKTADNYVSSGLKNWDAQKLDRAMADFNAAIQLEPKSASAHFNRGSLYFQRDKLPEAIADFDVTIREDPNDLYAYLCRGSVQAKVGNREKAQSDFKEAVRRAPNTARGHLFRAEAYNNMGDYNAAAPDFDQAKRMSPRDHVILNANSWFKATCPGASFRNGNEALQDGLKACELSRWTKWDYVDTLAAAYAETGNFEQAIKYESQVIGMVVSERASQAARERLNLFRAHKPYRKEPKLGKRGI